MVSKIKLIKPPISLNRKYFLNTNQFFHHIVYHPQIKIMIFRYYIGYLSCPKILINNALLQDHLLVQLNHCPNYLLTITLSKIKDDIKQYTDIIYSRNGVYLIWILKNSKVLLEHLKSKAISKVSSIKALIFPLFIQFSMNK